MNFATDRSWLKNILCAIFVSFSKVFEKIGATNIGAAEIANIGAAEIANIGAAEIRGKENFCKKLFASISFPSPEFYACNSPFLDANENCIAFASVLLFF